jgi:uncharacterized protein (TIGR02284 family)
MKNNEQIVSDLKEVLEMVNDGKEGYESAFEATDSQELKAVFAKLMGERIVFAAELKEHIATHDGDAENENGGILGGIHRTWLTIKHALTIKKDHALLEAIITGEKAALEKYDVYIANYERHADHLKMLSTQRDAIAAAVAEIQGLSFKYTA